MTLYRSIHNILHLWSHNIHEPQSSPLCLGYCYVCKLLLSTWWSRTPPNMDVCNLRGVVCACMLLISKMHTLACTHTWHGMALCQCCESTWYLRRLWDAEHYLDSKNVLVCVEPVHTYFYKWTVIVWLGLTWYRIAVKFRGRKLLWIGENTILQIAHFYCAKEPHAPNFAEKTFAYSHKTKKNAKVFSLKSFHQV